jgi:hypothetical protein
MHVVAAAVHEDLDVVDVDFAIERELDRIAPLLLGPRLHAARVHVQLDGPLRCRPGRWKDEGEEEGGYRQSSRAHDRM